MGSLAALEGGFRGMVEETLQPTVSIAGRRISTFQICGAAGFAAAVVAALALGLQVGLSVAVLAVLAAAAAATFLVVVLVTRAILGEERIVYYHHELAVLAVVALVLALFGRPVLPYLDVSVVALGVFLGCGRIGCASVGCCHGRPHRLGWRYRSEHADAGFAPWLVGVPLLPVQLVESLAVEALTGAAAVRLWIGAAPPGAVLASQLVGYALLRFVLELGRGDGERPMWAGLSEAQWISLCLALAVVVAERAQWLPPSAVHAALTAALVMLALALGLWRRRRASSHRLFAAAHVSEVARALAAAAAASPAAAPGGVSVLTTSLGVRLSYGMVDDRTHLYTVSGVEARTARTLSSLILLLRQHTSKPVFIEKTPALFHLLVR